MNRVFRVIILMAVLFGMIGLAQNQVAWAADSPETTDQSILGQTQASVSPDYDDDDCNDPWNKHRPRCNKDKIRDKIRDRIKKFCKNHPRLCKSIIPPPRWLLIPLTGDYSIGGLCTLSIVVKDPEVQLEASVIAPLPHELPEKVKDVTQGCLLEYSDSNERINKLLAVAGSTTICFAAFPGKQATIYYYNNYSLQSEWVSLETTADVGKACAPASESGVYVVTITKP